MTRHVAMEVDGTLVLSFDETEHRLEASPGKDAAFGDRLWHLRELNEEGTEIDTALCNGYPHLVETIAAWESAMQDALHDENEYTVGIGWPGAPSPF